MIKTTYQKPEIRDANDNIIQQGAFGKNTALANSTNDGWIDYVANNLEALYNNINGARIYVANKAALPTTGDLSAMYIAEDTGKWYVWDGNKYIETDNARKIADEAIAARDAAKASQAAAKTSEQNAKTSETNAAASAKAAATSAGAAKTSENNAGTQANTAKAWATSTASPDGAADTSSTTGKTQSARSWALYSKDRATASASSASAAAGSAGAAKTSETNAASSKTAAATSATNAANSAKAAANSATAAANSAREQQADWNVTDTTSKAFIKNKPEIYPNADELDGYHENSFLRYRGKTTINGEDTLWGQIGIKGYGNCLPEGVSGTYNYGAVVSLPTPDDFRLDIWYNHKCSSNGDGLWYRSGFAGDKKPWARLLDSNNYNDFISKAIANTKFVQGELTNYLPLSGGTVTGDLTVTGTLDGTASGNLPLSGGTLTGVVNGVTPTAGDNSAKIATTEFVNAKAGNYLPLSGGTVTGDLDVTSDITCNSVTSHRVNVRSGRFAPVNTLQRSTAYSVDDIVYTSALNAKYYLLCVTAGTTSATMPSFRGAGSNTEVTDGTVVWRVQTITSQESQETDVANISTGLTQAETRINALENSKVDKAGNAWVVETYRNGTEWYRVWSDGWIEQGGYFEKKRDKALSLTVTFLKPYVDNEYTFTCMLEENFYTKLTTKTTTAFSMETNSWYYDMYWRTEGKGA